MTSTVLVLGAAGRVGQVITQAFADAGWSVRAQARKALPAALQGHPRVVEVRCDATDIAALTNAASGAQVVVNALNPVYTDWPHQVPILANAALAAARASGALLMLPGNVYNYGRELAAVLGTDTPEQGNTEKARLRIDMEAALEAAAVQGVDSVVIRAGDFFGGHGKGTWLDLAMATKLAKGQVTYPGNPDVAHAWAYLPDLAQAFVKVAGRRAQLRGHHRVHFAGHTLTGRDIAATLAAIAGRPMRIGTMPWTVIKLGAPFMPMWRALLEMRYLWERPHALDGSSLRALVGEVQHTPLLLAMRSALRDAGLSYGEGSSEAAFLSASARS